jgi:serine/threonine protein kinase
LVTDRGNYKYSEFTDVYSYGITLFEILFERFPFGEKYLNNQKLFLKDLNYTKKILKKSQYDENLFLNKLSKEFKPELTNDEKLFLKNNEIENKIYNLCVDCLNDDPNKRPNFIKIKENINQITKERKISEEKEKKLKI